KPHSPAPAQNEPTNSAHPTHRQMHHPLRRQFPHLVRRRQHPPAHHRDPVAGPEQLRQVPAEHEHRLPLRHPPAPRPLRCHPRPPRHPQVRPPVQRHRHVPRRIPPRQVPHLQQRPPDLVRRPRVHLADLPPHHRPHDHVARIRRAPPVLFSLLATRYSLLSP